MLRADAPLDFDATASDRSAQVIQIESLGKGGIAYLLFAGLLSAVMAAFALGLSSKAADKADRAEREARMLQYYVLEMDAKLIAAGFKTDAESVAKKLKEK
jgi:hypothetical protein